LEANKGSKMEHAKKYVVKRPERDSFEDFVLDNFFGQDVNRRLSMAIDCDRVLLKPTVRAWNEHLTLNRDSEDFYEKASKPLNCSKMRIKNLPLCVPYPHSNGFLMTSLKVSGWWMNRF
jgi:hypothetical protein